MWLSYTLFIAILLQEATLLGVLEAHNRIDPASGVMPPMEPTPTPVFVQSENPEPEPTPAYKITPYTLWQHPTITAERVEEILHFFHSPAEGTGHEFHRIMVEHGIDPALALGFFAKESTFGRFGVATQTKGMGNVVCGDYREHGGSCIYSVDRWWRSYTTWEEGYRDWADRLTTQYKTGNICKFTRSPCAGPLLEVAEIVPVYAPSFENDTLGYIEFVHVRADLWRAGGFSAG